MRKKEKLRLLKKKKTTTTSLADALSLYWTCSPFLCPVKSLVSNLDSEKWGNKRKNSIYSKRFKTSPSPFFLSPFKTCKILTDLNIAGNNNRLRAIKSKIKPLLPSDIPHIMEIFYNAPHLWSSIHYKLYYARNIMMTCGVNCPALIGFLGDGATCYM